jgi:hypothetical protein
MAQIRVGEVLGEVMKVCGGTLGWVRHCERWWRRARHCRGHRQQMWNDGISEVLVEVLGMCGGVSEVLGEVVEMLGMCEGCRGQ